MELQATYACEYCGTAMAQKNRYCCSACELLGEQFQPVAQPDNSAYAYLDQENFRHLYRQTSSNGDLFTFYAAGLHCSSCVHLLEKLPEFDRQILEARVHFGKSTVTVRLSPTGSVARVADLIQQLGYQPTPIAGQEQSHDHIEKENRAALIRIAVAGFCAGNMMLFVIPVYAGLEGKGAVLFNWMSFFLFLPILFYSAVPFYRGAWSSLKYQSISVDLPIVVAMLTGFVLSLANLIRGDGAIYFDSTASFLFFILSARYLLKKTQQIYLNPDQKKSLFQNQKYLRSKGKTSGQLVSWQELEVGDEVWIEQNQTLPAEAVLLSPRATLDLSLFNGESLPRIFSQGMTVFGGTRILDDHIHVRIEKPFSASRIGRLFQQLEEGLFQKNRMTTITDRLAQKLILTVFATALIFFVIYSQYDLSEAFNRALALVVLACPCALAFGTPLTYGLALKKAQTLGILIKSSSALERILSVKNIFFDKTGTLTEGSLTLTETHPHLLSTDLQKAILSLEAISHHPIAFALRRAWPIEGRLEVPIKATERLGKGLSGYIGGDFYEIQDLAESTHLSKVGVEVFKNKTSVARLYFSDPLRKDSAASLQALQTRGYNCHLVSGDKKHRVLDVAQKCGIDVRNAHGNLFPEDKKDLIEKAHPCCMIGDGANDSLGLQAADVGIAVQGSVELSLSSADIAFVRGGLRPFLDLLALAQQTKRTLYRNLTLSLVYNLIGGTLALLGFISPMVAAVLMPISSVAIILSSIWGLK